MSRRIRYLSLEELLVLVTLLGDLKVRDLGLLDSATHRPRSAFAGQEAYPTVELKAAALLHSITKDHALFDGNNRLAWTASLTFLDLNGYDSDLSPAAAIALVLDVAAGDMDVADIAARLQVSPAAPRSR